MLLGMALLLVPACLDMATTFWLRSTNGQSPVILAAAAFMYWHARDAFDWSSAPAARRVGAGLLVLALLLGAIGQAVRFLQLEGLAIAVAGPGLCLAWGATAPRRLWRANLLLLAAIPLPGSFADALLVPLKRMLSEAVVTLLGMIGYPVALNGVIISIGFHQLQVADACSGLWSMIALVVIGLLYELLMRSSRKRVSVLFLLMIAPVALLTNFLRVLALVLIVHHFGTAAEAVVHDAAALLELVLSLGLFSLTHLVLERLFGVAERQQG